VVFADTSVRASHTDIEMLDAALAGENLMLAAHALGLGTVWLAAWPYEEFMSTIREILGAPEDAVPVAMFAVGVPAKAPSTVDRFDPSWVYSEQYGRL
jgi:nitroreductase